MSCDLEDGFSALADAIRDASPNSGLEALAAAIAGQQSGGCSINIDCCSGSGGRSGSGGSGSTAPSNEGITEGEPSTDPPPDGFDEWSEYFTNKCSMATYLVGTLSDDLGRLGSIDFELKTIGTLATIMIALLLNPIPGDEILGLAAILIGIVTVASDLLRNMQTVVGSNSQDLICALYTAKSSYEAESAIQVTFSDAWDNSEFGGGSFDWAAKLVFNTMVTSAMTNKLFQLQTSVSLPEGDCSYCEEDECFTFDTDLEGWTYLGAFAGWGLSGGYLNHDEAGVMVQGSSSTNYTGAISPTIEHVIAQYDNIAVQVSSFGSGAHSQYVGAVIDGEQVEVSTSFGTLSATTYYADLSEWEGQTIENIFNGWYHNGAFSVGVTSVCIVNIPPS